MGSRSLFAALVLASSLAWGQEARHVAPGYVITEPSWVYTDEGQRRVAAWIEDAAREGVKCRTENAALKDSVTKVSAEPALTWRATLILVAVGLVVGVAVAVPVTKLAGR